jgi:hypothetical protein
MNGRVVLIKRPPSYAPEQTDRSFYQNDRCVLKRAILSEEAAEEFV